MKYKKTFTVIITIIACTLVARADDQAPKSISVESLDTIPVIGMIGVPLGKVATVRATVVDGESLGMKASQGHYLLKITEVDGTKLNSEPIIRFSLAPGSEVQLASNNFELYELKTGKKAESLTDEQMVAFKKDYVGRSLLLQVYELGGFSGIPKNMPKEVMIWQDRGFGFRTYLRVLREVAPK